MATKKETLLTTALAAITTATYVGVSEPTLAATKSTQKCFGINEGKDHSFDCSVSDKQIKAAIALDPKYAASKPHDCGGSSNKGAKDGILNWSKVKDSTECFKKGGFIIVKGKGKDHVAVKSIDEMKKAKGKDSK